MMKNEVKTLIARLEQGTWPIERWHHAEHLAMAVWYLHYLPRGQALDVIRRRILLYNEAHGIAQTGDGGYHETLTLFLAEGIGAFLDALPENLELDARLRRVLTAFADFRSMLRAHYTASTLMSWSARARWIEPDLLPMSAWLKRCAELARACPPQAPSLKLAS